MTVKTKEQVGGLMTITQATEYLSVSRSKLYQLMQKGELPSVKIGRLIRLPRKAVNDLANRGVPEN